MTASTRRELRSAATSTSTTAIDLIRALTDARPIKPTSTRCLSARRPNPGRGSTYRCGNSVQTTAATSQGSIAACGCLALLLILLVDYIKQARASLCTMKKCHNVRLCDCVVIVTHSTSLYITLYPSHIHSISLRSLPAAHPTKSRIHHRSLSIVCC